ncbi:MAG: hypothetical protein ACYTFM_07220 [Planctomycetota bacterium]
MSDQPDITALLQLGSVHGLMPLSFWKRMRRFFGPAGIIQQLRCDHMNRIVQQAIFDCVNVAKLLSGEPVNKSQRSCWVTRFNL